jgi:uncharacterized iron-regulated protein
MLQAWGSKQQVVSHPEVKNPLKRSLSMSHLHHRAQLQNSIS